MRDHITNYVKICPVCKRNKRQQKKFGLLPPKEAKETPWDKLCVDLISPYKIRRKGEKELICKCVTMIDPATGWFKIQQYDDKQSITVANIVEQECRAVQIRTKELSKDGPWIGSYVVRTNTNQTMIQQVM
jgi:hypothetical protein